MAVSIPPEIETKLELIVSKTIIISLLGACFVGVFLIGNMATENLKLNQAYQDAYGEFDIYAIPSSELRVDVAGKEAVRLRAIVRNVSQYMLTFNPDNFMEQQKEIKKFLTSDMLMEFDNIQADATKNQIFIPSGTPQIKITSKKSANGKLVRNVWLGGILKLVDSRYKERGMTTKNIQIAMEVEEVAISKTNPYGFLIAKFEKKVSQ